MSTATPANESEVSILARIFDGQDGRISEELARYLLDLRVGEKDRARMHELAVRNQDDDLNPDEKEELIAFAKATSLLSLLKSKARRTLGIKAEQPNVS